MTRTWSVAEAKAKLSEVLASSRDAPQTIRSRGVDVAVVVSVAELSRLQRAAEAKPTPMVDFLSTTRAMKSAGSLQLRLPKRRVGAPRTSPFEE